MIPLSDAPLPSSWSFAFLEALFVWHFCVPSKKYHLHIFFKTLYKRWQLHHLVRSFCYTSQKEISSGALEILQGFPCSTTFCSLEIRPKETNPPFLYIPNVFPPPIYWDLEDCTQIQLLHLSNVRMVFLYLEDHPMTCKWLIPMISRSPKDRVNPLPNGLFMAYKWGLLTTY